MTIKTPSRNEVKRQLKRIRRAKKQLNAKKDSKSEISARKRNANVHRLSQVVNNLGLEPETEEQKQDTLTPDFAKGEQLVATVDRISRTGNAISATSDNSDFHVNLGKINCKRGDEVAITIDEVHDTHAKAQAEFIWNSPDDPHENSNTSQKVTRISKLKPHTNPLDNRNDLLNGHK